MEISIETKTSSLAINNPSHVIELLMPAKYKSSADNIKLFVRTRSDESSNDEAQGTAVSQFHRCVKCCKSFTSPDLLAGHKLLDDGCQETQLKLECDSCGVQPMTSYQHLISHYLQCHTEVVSGIPSILTAIPTTPALTTLALPETTAVAASASATNKGYAYVSSKIPGGTLLSQGYYIVMHQIFFSILMLYNEWLTVDTFLLICTCLSCCRCRPLKDGAVIVGLHKVDGANSAKNSITNGA